MELEVYEIDTYEFVVDLELLGVRQNQNSHETRLLKFPTSFAAKVKSK